MPEFSYSAVDRAGRIRTGNLSSSDPAAARRMIERRGLVVTRIAAPQQTAGATAPTANAPNLRISSRALALFTRQLATLLTAAPAEEAIRTLREQIDNRRVRDVLDLVHEGVLEGQRLSAAMMRAPRAFPPTYCAMVAAGESSGALGPVLDRLADLLERQQDVRGKLASALVYPIILAVVAMAVIIGLMAFVVPRVVDQFSSSGQALPPLTNAIIAISSALQNWGWLIALVILGLGALGALALSRPPVRLAFDAWVLRLPVAGRLLRDAEAAGFARTLSTMLGSGLPVYEALQLATPAVRNTALRAAVSAMSERVREGASLSSVLRASSVFPPLLGYLAASGEEGGRIDAMLERAADYLERDFRNATSIALSLLEPAIIVVMGGIVCLVILSILLPILQINTLRVG